MAERVIVVGGGGFGRELMCWVEDSYAAGSLPPLAGYIDDNDHVLTGYPPRLGSIANYCPAAGDLLALAIAKPSLKRSISIALKGRGARFTQVIHPTAIVVRTAVMGEGVIMCPGSSLMPDSSVGDFVTILNYTGIGHDSTVGAFTTFSSMCDVTGGVTIGSEVFVGSGARLLPGITVGNAALIGAGTTVVRSVKGGNTVFAAPPKTLKAAKTA